MSDESLDDLLRRTLPENDDQEFLSRVMVQMPFRRERSTLVLAVGLLVTLAAFVYFVPAAIFEDVLGRIEYFLDQSIAIDFAFGAILLSWMLVGIARK